MVASPQYSAQALNRIRLFGVLFFIIGLFFSIHGGWHLMEIYSRKMTMFELEAVFTPEKGRMWSEFLAGLSVSLVGVLMTVQAGIYRKQLRRKG